MILLSEGAERALDTASGGGRGDSQNNIIVLVYHGCPSCTLLVHRLGRAGSPASCLASAGQAVPWKGHSLWGGGICDGKGTEHKTQPCSGRVQRVIPRE